MDALETVVQLAEPFPTRFVHDDGRGNAYVPHHIVQQRLIQIFGVPPKIEILRELYDDTDQGKKLTGVVMRLTLPGLEPVEEAGEADNPQSKTNGARAKDACSDAIKRCAMRLGCGLSLWAQDDYYLFDKLNQPSKGGEVSAEARPSQPSNTQAGGEVSADVSGAGTDNEGDPGELGEVPFAEAGKTPAPAPGKKSGSAMPAPQGAQSGAEPQGAGDSPSLDEDASPSAPAPSPIPPATDLVNAYGKVKVLKAARRFAAANGIDEPGSWEEINEPLSIIVGKELAKAGI